MSKKTSQQSKKFYNKWIQYVSKNNNYTLKSVFPDFIKTQRNEQVTRHLICLHYDKYVKTEQYTEQEYAYTIFTMLSNNHLLSNDNMRIMLPAFKEELELKLKEAR